MGIRWKAAHYLEQSTLKYAGYLELPDRTVGIRTHGF